MAQRLKTPEEHALQGTVAKPAQVVESFVAPGRPRYPKGISKDAKRVFKDLCKLLAERRTLSEADGYALRLYVILHDRHVKAIEKIAVEGEITMYTRLDANGRAHEVEKTNLWLGVAERTEKLMAGILQTLGLTPNAKDRGRPTRTQKPTAEVDPMEDFLRRGEENRNRPVLVPIAPADMLADDNEEPQNE